jgi:intein/homing endonuclease
MIMDIGKIALNDKGYKILTPDGFVNFGGVSLNGVDACIVLNLEGDLSVRCTVDHKLYIDDTNYILARQLNVGDDVMTYYGRRKILSLGTTDAGNVYDLINVDSGNKYYADDVLVSNCEFVTFENTLISSTKLYDLQGIDPIHKQGQVRWYKKPSVGNIYCIALDPSLGTGGDYAAIQVFEATTTTQIAEWRHNKTPVPMQVRIMYDIMKSIHDVTEEAVNIYYSIENNTLGEAALISLEDFGEDKFPGMFLTENKKRGIGRRIRKGFTTTNKTKLEACDKFKTLVESEKLTITSKSLVSELKNFVEAGAGYAAKLGETDDLVMACILIIRMITQMQNYHPELHKQIKDHADNSLEPMPFIIF